MKRTIVVLVLILFSCEREDVLLSANDELYGLKLYKSNEFEILYNGFNTAEGKFKYRNDTIYLTYNSDEDITDDKNSNVISANEVLPRMIVIDRVAKRVKSLGIYDFSARIQIDKLKDK